jgi:hypothetical protein
MKKLPVISQQKLEDKMFNAPKFSNRRTIVGNIVKLRINYQIHGL